MAILEAERDNLPRWHQRTKKFFEIYYLKWNDPQQQVAAWLRYTLLAPTERPPEASLWGIFFDAKNPQNNRALKGTVPLGETRIEDEIFYFAIKSSAIFQAGARGELKSATDRMSWDLKFEEPSLSLRHFPTPLYSLPLPRTKLLAPYLSCRISGEFVMNERRFLLQAVPGHQAHLWGSEQAVSWSWGHCNSFKGAEAVFEGLTARIRWGKKLLRPITLFYLRYQGKSYSFLSPLHWFKNKSQPENCRWQFEATGSDLRIVGNFQTQPEQMVGVRYEDPSGSFRFCHNTKVADLKIDLFRNKGGWKLEQTLTAEKTAAFESVGLQADPSIKFYI